MTIVKSCRHNFTQCAYFMIFFVSSISYRPTDLSLLNEFSKNVSFSNSYKLPSQSAVQKLSMSTVNHFPIKLVLTKILHIPVALCVSKCLTSFLFVKNGIYTMKVLKVIKFMNDIKMIQNESWLGTPLIIKDQFGIDT